MKVLVFILGLLLPPAVAQAQQVPNPVSGPGVTTALDSLPCWGNTSGNLIKACGVIAMPTQFGTPPTQWPPLGFTSPASFVVDTTKQTVPAITYMTNASGTVPAVLSDTAQMPLFWLYQKGALVGSGVNTSIGLFEANYNDTGTTANNDSFTGVTGNCNLLGARPSTGGVGLVAACVGVVGAARGFQSQGGALGFEQGELHAMNIVAGLSNIYATPSNYYDIIGAESNITGCTGCTMKIRIGFNSGDFGNGGSGDSEQGSLIDAAYAIFSVAGTRGWKYGIDFAGAPVYGGNALSPAGTVLGSTAATPTLAAQGIDLQNFTISGNAFRSTGFAVSGTGALTASLPTSAGGGGLAVCVDTAGAMYKKATCP